MRSVGSRSPCLRGYGRSAQLGAHRVEAAVDVDQLTVDPSRQVREQERDRLPDGRRILDVPTQRRAPVPRAADLLEPGDPLAGHRLDRAGADGVHPDLAGAEVTREV